MVAHSWFVFLFSKIHYRLGGKSRLDTHFRPNCAGLSHSLSLAIHSKPSSTTHTRVDQQHSTAQHWPQWPHDLSSADECEQQNSQYTLLKWMMMMVSMMITGMTSHSPPQLSSSPLCVLVFFAAPFTKTHHDHTRQTHIEFPAESHLMANSNFNSIQFLSIIMSGRAHRRRGG